MSGRLVLEKFCCSNLPSRSKVPLVSIHGANILHGKHHFPHLTSKIFQRRLLMTLFCPLLSFLISLLSPERVLTQASKAPLYHLSPGSNTWVLCCCDSCIPQSHHLWSRSCGTPSSRGSLPPLVGNLKSFLFAFLPKVCQELQEAYS